MKIRTYALYFLLAALLINNRIISFDTNKNIIDYALASLAGAVCVAGIGNIVYNQYYIYYAPHEQIINDILILNKKAGNEICNLYLLYNNDMNRFDKELHDCIALQARRHAFTYYHDCVQSTITRIKNIHAELEEAEALLQKRIEQTNNNPHETDLYEQFKKLSSDNRSLKECICHCISALKQLAKRIRSYKEYRQESALLYPMEDNYQIGETSEQIQSHDIIETPEEAQNNSTAQAPSIKERIATFIRKHDSTTTAQEAFDKYGSAVW
jgi:DNA repair ATPase RecN